MLGKRDPSPGVGCGWAEGGQGMPPPGRWKRDVGPRQAVRAHTAHVWVILRAAVIWDGVALIFFPVFLDSLLQMTVNLLSL